MFIRKDNAEPTAEQLVAAEASKAREDGGEGHFVTRHDFGTLGKFERTPSGGVRIPAHLTRVGVFTYRKSDGSPFRELRPSDEVFKDDSLSSLAGAPVTDLHPKSMVGPSNWKNLAIGHVSEKVDQTDERFVTSHLLVQDSAAIDKIASGQRREISMGYTCRLDHTPGTFNGQEYDAVQRDIRYNHAAIGPTKWGRAGSEVQMHLDSMDNTLVPVPPEPKKQEKATMKTVRIDGRDYEVGSAEHLAKLDEMADARVAEVQAKLDEANGTIAGQDTQIEEMQASLDAANDPETIAEAVKIRADLEARARKVLGEDAVFDDMTDVEVMSEAIYKVDESHAFDEHTSEDYIRGLFTAVTNVTKKDSGNLGKTRRLTRDEDNGKPFGKDKDEDEDEEKADAGLARKKFLQDSRNAWKRPLAYSKDN